MSADWIGDPFLTPEEKMARFEALDPAPSRGPTYATGVTYCYHWDPAAGFVAVGQTSSNRWRSEELDVD